MPRKFWISAPTMAARIVCPTQCGTWPGCLTSTPVQETSPRRLYAERTGRGGNTVPVLPSLSAASLKASTARIILSWASRSLSTLQQWMCLRLIILEPSSRFWPAPTTPSPRTHLLMSGKDNHLSWKTIISQFQCFTVLLYFTATSVEASVFWNEPWRHYVLYLNYSVFITCIIMLLQIAAWHL